MKLVKSFRRDIVLLVLLSLTVRMPFLFMVPMVEAPDEFAHFWMYKFLSENMSLPGPQEIAAGGASAVYGSLPPLGYIPHVLACKMLPGCEISLVGRCGSLFMGVLTVVCAYLIGLRIFAGSRLLARALPLVLVFHPQLVLVHSYANNDSTACAVASLIFLGIISLLQDGPRWLLSAGLGGLTGWLILCKYSALCLVVPVCLAILALPWVRGTGFAALFAHLACWAGVSTISCAWWFLRNYNLYNGDLLGVRTMRETWAAIYHQPLMATKLSHILKDRFWWQQIWYSFWGMFGYMKRPLPLPFYSGYAVLVILAALGGLQQLGKKFNLTGRQAATASLDNGSAVVAWHENRSEIVIWSVLIVAVVINLASMVVGASQNLGGAQGRYLFPCEVPIVALILAGLSSVPRLSQCLIVCFVLFTALTYVQSLCLLIPVYGFHLKPY